MNHEHEFFVEQTDNTQKITKPVESVSQLRAHNGASVTALEYIDVSLPVTPRKWAVHERIPAGNTTLFSGEGAMGKTLVALQLGVAHVLAADWFGTMPEPGDVIYISCEDDADEIRRRLESITRHYQVLRTELIGKLHTASWLGRDATLATFDRGGLIKPTKLFKELESDVIRHRPKHVFIDTAADVFGGDEINRTQVRRFINLLTGMAQQSGAAITLISHPSLTGISSGSGLSGSTAWHNTVRARMYLRAHDEEPSLRVLEFKKSNYGPISESVNLCWQNGVYVPEQKASPVQQQAKNNAVDDLFIQLLRKLTNSGRAVSPNPSVTYAPKVMSGEAEAKSRKVSNNDLKDSMSRLFDAKKIRVEVYGPPSHGRSRIVEVAP